MNGINLAIYEFKQELVNTINNSGLPPGILIMILNELTGQMQIQNARMIELERKSIEEGDEDGKEIHKD